MAQQLPQWFIDKVNRIEAKLDLHLSNAHGRHGLGPGKVINRQNAQTGGVVAVALALIELVRYLV